MIVATLLVVAGLLLVPWLLYMSTTLPTSTRAHNWSLMWTGIDTAEAVGLIVTGVFMWRRSPYRALPAAFTSAMLTLDAWVDVTTSAPGHARVLAIVMAFGGEIPVAIVCLALAVTSMRLRDRDLEGAGRPAPKPGQRRAKSIATGLKFHRIGTD